MSSLLEQASLVVTPNGTKASKLYSVKPTDGSGDMTVVRATTATRVNSNGLIESVASNVPRIDYTDSTCPSVLVEPQRTNLFTYSEQFDNASWIKSNSTINANSIISPDGSLTADKLIEDTSNSSHYFRSDFTLVNSGNLYTYSIFAKKAERNFILIFDSYVNSGYWFDLDTGVVGSKYGAGTITANIKNFGNGWYKCSITFTADSSGYALLFNNVSNADNVNSYLGNGTSGIYFWGAQLEAGANATSYIPTTTATVTRNADVISKTGISSLIGQTEGTLFSNFYYKGQAKGATQLYPFYIGQGTYENSITIGIYEDKLLCRVFVSGTAQNGFTSSDLSIGNHKVAFVYANNNLKLFLDGVLIATDTSATIPTCNQIYIGSSGTSVDPQTINVNNNMLFKTVLTDQQCIDLTTI